MKYSWVLYLVAAIPLAASAESISDPFYTANRSPLMVNSGLSAAESAQLVARGKYTVGAFLDLTNNATATTHPDEQIILNGETRQALAAGYVG